MRDEYYEAERHGWTVRSRRPAGPSALMVVIAALLLTIYLVGGLLSAIPINRAEAPPLPPTGAR